MRPIYEGDLFPQVEAIAKLSKIRYDQFVHGKKAYVAAFGSSTPSIFIKLLHNQHYSAK